MDFYMSTRLITGNNCILNNAEMFSEMGQRCLIVTGKSSAKRCGALGDVTEALGRVGIGYSIYDEIVQNPTIASCIEAGKLAKGYGADFIIGIGGGSPLDAAKIVAVCAANPKTEEDDLYARKWIKDALPVLLIGTTAGTGSEVTPVSVLTDSRGRKRSIRDERIYAKISFGDPRYTETLPRKFVLSTAVDALAHCIESYFSKKANDISAAFALRGAAILRETLGSVLQSNTKLDSDQRERLYNASILGGLAISVTGTTFPHNMGYFLSEDYGVAHGNACAVYLPELLRYAEKCAPERISSFFAAIGGDIDCLIDLIERITPKLDIILTEEDIKRLMPRWENNSSVASTVGNVTADMIEKILRDKFCK